jgi:hypothetical protein
MAMDGCWAKRFGKMFEAATGKIAVRNRVVERVRLLVVVEGRDMNSTTGATVPACYLESYISIHRQLLARRHGASHVSHVFD